MSVKRIIDEPDLGLAVNAAMATIDRYGGLWSNDQDSLRYQLEIILSATMDLGSDDSRAWRDSRDTLKTSLTTDHP